MNENKRTSRVEIVLGDLEEEQFDLFDGLSHDQARKLARHMQEVGENWIRTEPLAGDQLFAVQLSVSYGGFRHVRGEYWFEDYEKANRLAEQAVKRLNRVNDEHRVAGKKRAFYKAKYMQTDAAMSEGLPYVLMLVSEESQTVLASARFSNEERSIRQAIVAVQTIADSHDLFITSSDPMSVVDSYLEGENKPQYAWYRVDWTRRGAAAEQANLPYVLKLVLGDGNTTLASARFAADDASIARSIESVQTWLHDTPGLELAGADARQNIDEFLVFMNTNDPEGSLD